MQTSCRHRFRCAHDMHLTCTPRSWTVGSASAHSVHSVCTLCTHCAHALHVRRRLVVPPVHPVTDHVLRVPRHAHVAGSYSLDERRLVSDMDGSAQSTSSETMSDDRRTEQFPTHGSDDLVDRRLTGSSMGRVSGHPSERGHHGASERSRHDLDGTTGCTARRRRSLKKTSRTYVRVGFTCFDENACPRTEQFPTPSTATDSFEDDWLYRVLRTCRRRADPVQRVHNVCTRRATRRRSPETPRIDVRRLSGRTDVLGPPRGSNRAIWPPRCLEHRRRGFPEEKRGGPSRSTHPEHPSQLPRLRSYSQDPIFLQF